MKYWELYKRQVKLFYGQLPDILFRATPKEIAEGVEQVGAINLLLRNIVKLIIYLVTLPFVIAMTVSAKVIDLLIAFSSVILTLILVITFPVLIIFTLPLIAKKEDKLAKAIHEHIKNKASEI